MQPHPANVHADARVGACACRFRSENILNLELDMPERTTYDYVGPGVDPRVQVRKRLSNGCAGGGGARSQALTWLASR